MSKKIRLIARLDVKDTNLVKGIQLEGLRKLGDPNAFAKEYYEAGIDELLYIDIVASLYNRNNLSDIVRKTVDDVYIPVCVGGGLRSVEDVRHILSMGADKAAIKARYHEMLKRFHPDTNGGDRGAEAKLQAVIKAWKVLKKAGQA